MGLGPVYAASASTPPIEYRLAIWPHRAGTPEFRLVDTDNRPRTLADYRGQVVVLIFGFLRCPDVCPAELYKLAVVMKKLRAHVQVLFVTLDPDRDTPDLLKSYVAAFDPQFVGLTGTAAQIDTAAASFFVQYARVPSGNDYVINHSSGIFVIDATGRLRLLGTMKTRVDDLAHDLAALAAEK
jgi:protein SCO1/2